MSKGVVCEDDAPMAEAINDALDFSETTKVEWRKTTGSRIRALIARRRKATYQ